MIAEGQGRDEIGRRGRHIILHALSSHKKKHKTDAKK